MTKREYWETAICGAFCLIAIAAEAISIADEIRADSFHAATISIFLAPALFGISVASLLAVLRGHDDQK